MARINNGRYDSIGCVSRCMTPVMATLFAIIYILFLFFMVLVLIPVALVQSLSCRKARPEDDRYIEW